MSTDDIIGIVWFGGAGLLTLAVLFGAGWKWHTDRAWLSRNLGIDSPGEMAMCLVSMPVGAVLWPLAAALAVLSVPFWAGRAAASGSDRRRERLAAKQAEKRAALTELRNSFDRSEPEWDLLNTALQEVSK